MLLLIKLESNLAILKTNKISKNNENIHNDNNVAVGGVRGRIARENYILPHMWLVVTYCCCYGGQAHGSISL